MPTFQQIPVTLEPQQKKQFHIPRNILIGVGFFFVIATMIGGIAVLQARQQKSTPVRLTVPQLPVKPSPTAQPPSPTPNPIAGWKTFANKSFSMKYPERFTVIEKKPSFSLLYPKIHSSVAFKDGDSTITITVAANHQKLGLHNALGNGPSLRYANSLTTGKKVRTIPVDETDAIMVENIAAGQTGATRDIILIKHEKVYQLTLTPSTVDATTFMLMVSTFNALDQEPVEATDSWKLHADTAYGFSFRYPGTHALDFNKVASGSPTLTIVYDDTKIQVDTPNFKIEVQDVQHFGQSAITSREILKKNLLDYVNTKWEYNKAASDAAIPNKKISPISETAIDGKIAYQFSVTGKYVDDHVSETLGEEFLFIFTEHNGHKYKIWYPKNSILYTQLFNTLTFIQ